MLRRARMISGMMVHTNRHTNSIWRRSRVDVSACDAHQNDIFPKPALPETCTLGVWGPSQCIRYVYWAGIGKYWENH